MIEWYKKVVFENYVNFTGRARRSEYWYFVLCNFLITMIFYIPLLATGGMDAMNMQGGESPSGLFWLFYILLMLYGLATFLPNLGVTVRRLHDVGKSGWYYLIILIPFVGPIIMLVWLATDSQPGTNKWGPNPKEINTEIGDIGKY